jgi:4'-phosphopantetheinyl transferase
MAIPIALHAWPGLTLWRCALDAAPEDKLVAALDAAERARAARLVHEVHRRRYVAAHAALRALLADATGEAPDRLRFCDDAHGKPQLEHPSGWQFNLSHSEDLALIAMQSGAMPIGVDIEVMRPVDDALALARRHYTSNEQAVVAAAAEGVARQIAFLRVWTRKEACLKAVGLGLRLAPSSFEVGAGAGASMARLPAPRGLIGVEVRSIEAGPGVLAAVARVCD